MGDSVTLALKAINAAGGVNGKPVTQVGADEGTAQPSLVTQSTNTLLADKVQAIIGAASSGDTLAVIDKITSAPVVECSPSNTAASLTTHADGGYYFRTAPPDSLQSRALANVIVGAGHSNVELVGQATDYGKGFLSGLKSALTSTGATVAGEVTYDPNGTTFTAEAAKVKAAKPDAVVIIGYEETGIVIKDLIQDDFGPKQVPIYVADGAQSSTLWKSVDPKNPAVLVGVGGTAPSAAPRNGTKSFPAAVQGRVSRAWTRSTRPRRTTAPTSSPWRPRRPSPTPRRTSSSTWTTSRSAARLHGLLCHSARSWSMPAPTSTTTGASGPLDFTSVGEPSVGTYDVWKFDNKGADPDPQTDGRGNTFEMS